MPSTVVAVGIDDRTAQHLKTEGYVLEQSALAPRSLYERMVSVPADALILGHRTDLDGEFVECLREARVDTPAIRILNGPRNAHWAHKCAHFLDCGGDDVVVGSPNPQEVTASLVAASLRAVSRRAAIPPDHIARFKEGNAVLEVNLSKRRITLNYVPFTPTAHESLVMFALASIPGAVSRSALNEQIHGHGYEARNNSIEVLVVRLRKRLGSAASLLVTQRKEGYELVGRIQ